ncbi:MAG: hypothetical protein Q8O37_12540 [Sulfuricellaceae bacterium]|nr:hypothetical protein [Sulfuricellaceae bacterium]
MTRPTGYHLTPIGKGNYLLEPTTSLDIGDLDDLLVEVLQILQKGRARKLYYDLASLPLIEPRYYHWLNSLALACTAINVSMACLHMQPTAAFALASYIQASPAFKVERDVRE